MGEVEGRVLPSQLLKEAPHAEATFPYVGIVKQDDGVWRQLRDPLQKIILHIFIEMPPVDMEQVHRPVLEIGQRSLKG